MALPPFNSPRFGKFADDDQEAAFQTWYARHAARLHMSPSPDDPRHRYDFRNAFLEGYEPDENGLWDYRASEDFARTAPTRNPIRRNVRGAAATAETGDAVAPPDATIPDATSVSANLTEAQKQEALARLDAVQEKLNNYSSAINYYAKGMIAPEEAAGYRATSKDIDEYARRMNNHGRAYEQGYITGEQVTKLFGDGFMRQAATFAPAFVKGLTDTGLGALQAGVMGAMPGSPFAETTAAGLVAPLRDKIDRDLYALPTDPIQRAGYEAAFPGVSRWLGDQAAWMAVVMATSGLGEAAGLPRLLTASRGARGLVALNATGAVGGALIAASTAPDNADATRILNGAMVGLGGTALVSSLLAGRPFGTPARLIRLQEMAAALEANGVGGALRVAPRLTFGRLAMSGIEGAGYVTLSEMGRGTPVDQAIGQGVEEGLNFVGYDVAFIGLGRAARWLPLQKRVAELWGETATAFKIPSRIANMVTNMGAQAAPGAAIGGMLAGVPGAMAGGAITAAKAAELQRVMTITAARLRSTGALKAETIDKIITGAWTKLSADEAQAVTRALTKDTFARAAVEADPVLNYAINEALGSDVPLIARDELSQMAVQRAQLTQRLSTLRANGVLEIDPEVVQTSRALAELAERRSQMLIEQANMLGSRGAVLEKVNDAMMRDIVESASANKGLAIVGDASARNAASRLIKSAELATERKGIRGATEPATRIIFRTNATLLKDIGDTVLENAGIDAVLSREAERALERMAATRPALGGNVGRKLLGGGIGLPGGGEMRAVAPAGAKRVKMPLDDINVGFDERGAVRTDLLRVAGTSAAGALAGATLDDTSPTRGALVGAAAGAGLASAGERLLSRSARIEDRAASVERRSVAGRQQRETFRVRAEDMRAQLRAAEPRMTPAQIRRANALIDDVVRAEVRHGMPATSISGMDDLERAAHTLAAEIEAGRAGGVGRVRTGEAGEIRGGALGILGAGSVGAVLAPAIATRLGLLDEEDSVLTASAIGFLAASGIGYKMLERGGMKLDPVAARVARFVQPNTIERISDAEVSRIVGQTGNKFRVTINGSQVSGRRLYAILPQPQQIAHTVSVIDSWPARTMEKGKPLDLAARRARFERDLLLYAPYSLAEGDAQKITTAYLGAAKALGYSDAQTARIYKGWLGWMTTPLENRVPARLDQISLERLGRDARNPFNTPEGIAELQSRAATAEVITGPAAPLPRNYRRATNSLNRDGTPDATRIRALVDEIDGLGVELNTPGHQLPADTIYSLWHLPGLRMLGPNVRFYRFADQLMQSGQQHVGQLVHKVTNGIMQATELARAADDADRKIINEIFRGISSADEMTLVRQAVEDPAFRETLKGASPRIYEAALGVRKFLRDKAEQLGLPDMARIEDYFPWIYNYRTKRELADLVASGRVPTDVNYPIDAPVPRHVYFNHLEARTAAAPLGQQLNPLESLLMYAHGSNRKIMYDQLLANFNKETFAAIRTDQPEIGHELGRWLLDVLGVPGPGTMAIQKRVEQIGLWLEKFPMFQRPGLAQQINEEYFLKPGAANNLSRLVTGWSYYSKVAFNLLSSMTNLSQIVVNGMTEYGILNVLTSAIHGGTIAGAERSGPLAPVLAPVFDALNPRGAQYRKLMLERGILSETSQRHFDAIALYEAAHGTNRAHLVLSGGIVGATGGAAVTAFLNQDRATEDKLSVAGGALAGASVTSIGAAKSAIMRRALLRVRDIGTYPFNVVETFNRATSGIAAFKVAKQAQRAATDVAYRNRVELGEKVEGVIVGALGGAALGNLVGDDPLVGAAGGALLAAAASGRGESRTARAGRTLEALKRDNIIFSNRVIRDQAATELRPLTDEEVGTLYAQMQTDLTQFRIAKEGRNPYLNTPHGQALGALQSFTINQAEFVGGRLATFADTANRAIHGEPVKVDFRVFRYASFLLATGSVYGAILGGSSDTESDPDYWVSRLGFGVMPILHWNDAARRWEILSPTDLFKGPLIGDITRTANSYLALMTNEQANQTFADVTDQVVLNLFPGAKAIATDRKNREGAAALKLMQEGIIEQIAPGVQPPGRPPR